MSQLQYVRVFAFFLASLSILLFSVSLVSAVPMHHWSQRFGGAEASAGYGVAVDGSGNVFVTGHFEGTANFGGGDLVSTGDQDIFVAKYDANGVHQWSQRFGGTTDEVNFACAVDGAGNVILTALFSGIVDFGGGDLGIVGGNEVVVAKYDANGVHQWSQSSQTVVNGVRAIFGVAVDGSDNVLVTGSFSGTANFGGGDLVSAGGEDIVVAKYDANGVHQWSQRFGGPGAGSFDRGMAVAVDGLGNVIVTGFFEGTVDFGGGNLVSAGFADIVVAKYDASGGHLWSQNFGGAGIGSNWGQGVAVDGLGNVMVTGGFSGTADFGGGDLVSAGGHDIFVAKFDVSGGHQWSQRFGATEGEDGWRIAVDSSGNAMVTGWFSGTVNFGGGDLVSAGGTDIFLAKYDGSGVHQWSQRFGGAESDAGNGVAIDGSGNAVVTGQFAGTVDFGGGGLVSAGNLDVFLLKYGDDGVLPVFISGFDASHRGNAIDISWDFWSDEALDRFTLYRRHDAKPFVDIASGDARTARSYTDASVEPGQTYHYQLSIRTASGDDFRSPVATATVAPLASSLAQNFPNPFNPNTTIAYSVSEKAMVSIEIFDASGALIRRLDEGVRETGGYRAEWDGRDKSGTPVSSGVYFYRLAGMTGVETRKMVLMK